MSGVHHSVTLQTDLCKGCTHCIKRCPTEAIRVRDGKAVIKSERCIDCGECIRICPYQAKRAIYDTLDHFKDYKYKIALPAPALYGQFDKGLLACGFDDVFEVARAAELVSEYTRQYMKDPAVKKPAISAACPVVVRLISVRFPSLIDNVIPIMPPVELAARLAKKGVCTRAGMHCAPLAHEALGTGGEALRLSFSAFNTMKEAEDFCNIFLEITEEKS